MARQNNKKQSHKIKLMWLFFYYIDLSFDGKTPNFFL